METYIDGPRHDDMNGLLFGKYTYAFTSKYSFTQAPEPHPEEASHQTERIADNRQPGEKERPDAVASIKTHGRCFDQRLSRSTVN